MFFSVPPSARPDSRGERVRAASALRRAVEAPRLSVRDPATGELRRLLREEGRRALLDTEASVHNVHAVELLQLERLVEVVAEPLVEAHPEGRDGVRADSGGELAGDALGRLLERPEVRDDLVQEPCREHLLGRVLASEHEHLLRLGASHEVGEPRGRSAQRHGAAPRLRERERRALDGDAVVGGEQDLHAAAVGIAVDRRDRGLRREVAPQDRSLPEGAVLVEGRSVGVAPVVGPPALHVHAGREVPIAGAREDDAAHVRRFVAREPVPEVEHLLDHPVGPGVARIRAVHDDLGSGQLQALGSEVSVGVAHRFDLRLWGTRCSQLL